MTRAIRWTKVLVPGNDGHEIQGYRWGNYTALQNVNGGVDGWLWEVVRDIDTPRERTVGISATLSGARDLALEDALEMP